ncbi:MAG: hypothetical protein LC660_08595, partial [Desulfobacteraceae bacterium]|nr:hypothetical protein [Desulfobacteraceae bacterium]
EKNRKRPSLGLLSMRERTAILGGKFFLRTRKGMGTRIRIEIPVKNCGVSILPECENFLQEIYETSAD